MRFVNVLFLAFCQLTLVPFVAVLTENTLHPPERAQISSAQPVAQEARPLAVAHAVLAHNVSVIYKTVE